ncbi:MAG: hypothetical protein M3032_02865, partial [Verrucomicrobiota bacterium]|nr:hypothetical protein [Verrucomicrobiota bacterium]
MRIAAAPSEIPPAARSHYWGTLSDGAVNLFISAVACCIALMVCIAVAPQVAHWFAVPVLFCGIVIGCDAVKWARGGCDLFDPVGIVGLVGTHFFFFAPLLHVVLGYTLADELPPVDAPAEWRDWLGWMAVINFAGLLAYRGARSWFNKRSPAQPARTLWRIEGKNLLVAAACGLTISVIAQGSIYASYGGVSGFIETFSEKAGDANFSDAAFVGMG